MQAGALGAPLVVGALQATLGGEPGKGGRTAATGAAAWVVAKALKRQIRRGRPGDHEGGATLRMGAADEGLGFPSGHAAVAVTVAVSLAAGRGRLPATLAIALLGVVGAGRVYVGAHYPLDVVGGWGLGLVLSALSAPAPGAPSE
ncbi:MAG: phosphatase PAP2 family protein [Actinobacteria bacterium]|nr:MAG: phosphatase PAP2 family protein [Actinomycetota bacterium]